MCGRNVLQIGMYRSAELWVEAIFFIYMGSYVISFICLFVCCFFVIFVGWRPHLFTYFCIFCLFFLFIGFPVEGEQFMQQYTHKKKPCLQPSDVKTPKPVIDASMPKVMYIV